MRVGSIRPRGVSSSDVPPPPSSTGANTIEASGAAAADADVPPSTTSDDSTCLNRSKNRLDRSNLRQNVIFCRFPTQR